MIRDRRKCSIRLSFVKREVSRGIEIIGFDLVSFSFGGWRCHVESYCTVILIIRQKGIALLRLTWRRFCDVRLYLRPRVSCKPLCRRNQPASQVVK